MSAVSGRVLFNLIHFIKSQGCDNLGIFLLECVGKYSIPAVVALSALSPSLPDLSDKFRSEQLRIKP